VTSIGGPTSDAQRRVAPGSEGTPNSAQRSSMQNCAARGRALEGGGERSQASGGASREANVLTLSKAARK
jgi:hypothetical protein